MSTVNISLPKEQIAMIDSLVSSYGFANRSEFIRAILRFLTRKPSLLDAAVAFPFINPTEKSTQKILLGFKNTGKYSKVFLEDLSEGLKSSDYFTK